MSHYKNSLAYPYDGSPLAQEFGPGLTKFELACIHLISASVTANDHANPEWMSKTIAVAHAKNAVMLANALFNELGNEEGK